MMHINDNLHGVKNNYKEQPTFLIKRVCGMCVEVDFTQCYDTTTMPFILRPHQVVCKEASSHKSATDKPINVQKRSRY